MLWYFSVADSYVFERRCFLVWTLVGSVLGPSETFKCIREGATFMCHLFKRVVV